MDGNNAFRIIVFNGIPIICFIIAVSKIFQLRDKTRQRSKANDLSASGDWEQASLLLKQGIIDNLDTKDVLEAHIKDLEGLYRSQGMDNDLKCLYDCPEKLADHRGEPADTRYELCKRFHQETKEFLNGLPGLEIA